LSIQLAEENPKDSEEVPNFAYVQDALILKGADVLLISVKFHGLISAKIE